MKGGHMKKSSPRRCGYACGLLIRRPQVRTLLGPQLGEKQQKVLVRRLVAGTVTLAAFRRAFGVSHLMGGAS